LTGRPQARTIEIVGRLLISFVPLVLVACGSQGIDPNDLGTQDGGEGGATQGPPPTAFNDPFSGAPAYAKGSSMGSHPDGDESGTDCTKCHGKGGDGPALLIGGTVYKDYAGTTPAVGVEVRVVDTQGHAVSTYTNNTGMFAIRSSNANGVVFPAVVGARDGTTQRPMITQLTGTMGSCSQATCHVGQSAGGYYPIHVP
jgi:hypothetical protein